MPSMTDSRLVKASDAVTDQDSVGVGRFAGYFRAGRGGGIFGARFAGLDSEDIGFDKPEFQSIRVTSNQGYKRPKLQEVRVTKSGFRAPGGQGSERSGFHAGMFRTSIAFTPPLPPHCPPLRPPTPPPLVSPMAHHSPLTCLPQSAPPLGPALPGRNANVMLTC